MGELSVIRLLVMRILYALIAFLLGFDAWSTLLTRQSPWDPLHGIAFSFWAALSVMGLIGIRFPVRMLPILLLQFTYKVIWLAFVAYPLWTAGTLNPNTSAVFQACAIGVVVDLVAIPWGYVCKRYLAAALGREPAATP